MFDSYNVRAVSERVHTHVDIHEHRAPTDASVKLLTEMEEKAQARILDSVRLEGCEVDGVIHHMADPMNLSDHFVIDYRLGGKRVRIKHEVRSFKTGHELREQVVDELVKCLADSIAREILRGAVEKSSFKLTHLGR